jgi:hypothetical protein
MTYTDDTNAYAGPFCTCGDYSCPVSDNPNTNCVNRETPLDFADDVYDVIEDEDGYQTRV